MNRADNLMKLAREGIRDNAREMKLLQQDTARLEKIIAMFGGENNVSISPTGRKVTSGWKVGVTRDILKLFNSMASETWYNQERVAHELALAGDVWEPGTVANAVNKLARDGKLVRQGDPGHYVYAMLDTSPDRDTMKAGDGQS